MFEVVQHDLKQVIQLLEQASLQDNSQQKQVYLKIQAYSSQFDFYNYLAFILSQESEIQVNLRLMGVVVLKSLFERNFQHLPEENITYIKTILFSAFNDRQKQIRNAVGNLMTTIIYKGGFQKWPELLDFLMNNLQQKNNSLLIQNTLDCISKIVEDLRMSSQNFSYLDSSKGSSQLNLLIPKLFDFCTLQYNEDIQSVAISTLNQCIYTMPASMAENIDYYLEILLIQTKNNNCVVRQKAFSGIINMQEISKNTITKRADDIIQSVILGIQDSDYEVQKTACNFWLEYIILDDEIQEEQIQCLKNYLKNLLPALLRGLKYTNDDLINILPDTQSVMSKNQIQPFNLINESFDEGEENNNEVYQIEECNFYKDPLSNGQYTLRKMCGRTIEILSMYYRDDIFLICQPFINECFYNQDWMIKELGILCLGKIAEGSQNLVQDSLNTIIPSLIELCSQQGTHHLLQSTILWTISQYTNWFVNNQNNQNDLIKKYLQLIVYGISQSEEYLQEQSCFCLKTFVDQGSMILRPYLFEFIQVILVALKVYNNDNLSMLLQAIYTLVELMPDITQQVEIMNILVPSIIQKWECLDQFNPKINHIIECLALITSISGGDFAQYCQEIYLKCIGVMKNYFIISHKNTKLSNQVKQLFLSSFNLLDNIVYLLNKSFVNLQNTSDLLQIIDQSIEQQDIKIKIQTFNLLSEITKNSPELIKTRIIQYSQQVIQQIQLFPHNLDPSSSYLAVNNNAIMCLNEFCVNFQEIMQPFAYTIALKIIEILEAKQKLSQFTEKNFYQALCSIALLDIEKVSFHLDQFALGFCLCMKQCRSGDVLKLRAFNGFFQMCMKQPNKIVGIMDCIIETYMNYNPANESLQEQFKFLVYNFKKVFETEEQWAEFIQNGKISNKNIVRLKKQYF